MIGFKAVNHDFTAQNGFKYTIGETYNLPPGDYPKLCNNGFHFCAIPLCVFDFYNKPDDKFLLVEATGTIKSDEIKYCTNQLKIVKEINRETFMSESFHLESFKVHSNLITNDNKDILLKYAAEKGYFEIVKYLIEECNCDPHLCLEHALRRAVRNGHFEIVKYLIETHHCDPHVESEDALRWAVENGHLKIVKYLIETHKCDPHINSEYALRLASRNGHLEIVQYLIETHHCDPHVNEELALRLAGENGHLEIVKYLIGVCKCDPQHSEYAYALKMALRNEHSEIVKYFVEECNCSVKNELIII